jgi:hypothetical protein
MISQWVSIHPLYIDLLLLLVLSGELMRMMLSCNHDCQLVWISSQQQSLHLGLGLRTVGQADFA